MVFDAGIGLYPILIYFALSGLWVEVTMVFDAGIGLHPILIYFALSGLWVEVTMVFDAGIGLHPILTYCALFGLAVGGYYGLLCRNMALPYFDILRPFRGCGWRLLWFFMQELIYFALSGLGLEVTMVFYAGIGLYPILIFCALSGVEGKC